MNIQELIKKELRDSAKWQGEYRAIVMKALEWGIRKYGVNHKEFREQVSERIRTDLEKTIPKHVKRAIKKGIDWLKS